MQVFIFIIFITTVLGAAIRYELIFFFFRKGSIFVIFELIIKALTVENAVLTSLVEGFRELEEQGILPWPLDIEEDIHLEGEVDLQAGIAGAISSLK